MNLEDLAILPKDALLAMVDRLTDVAHDMAIEEVVKIVEKDLAINPEHRERLVEEIRKLKR